MQRLTFAGTGVKYWDGDFLEMHGPDPRSGSKADAPPLWLWQETARRLRAQARRELEPKRLGHRPSRQDHNLATSRAVRHHIQNLDELCGGSSDRENVEM